MMKHGPIRAREFVRGPTSDCRKRCDEGVGLTDTCISLQGLQNLNSCFCCVSGLRREYGMF